MEPEPAPGELVRLVLPPDGGTWPWPIGKADLSAQSTPVTFPNLAPFAVTGFSVRPEINRAAVSMKYEKKGFPAFTRLALCDTAAGKVLSEWPLPAQQAVLDLSADGRAILSTYSQPGKDRHTLRLWVVGNDGQLRRFSWLAHSASRPDGIRYEIGDRTDPAAALEIRWAGFVGNDRIVSLSRAGQLKVFDTDGPKPLVTVEGSSCRPAVTPDGSKIAFLTGNAVTLVDPVAGAVIGTRWVGPVPQNAALAFSPDGGKLAIGGNGKALFLNMISGDVQEAVLPKLHVIDTGMYDRPFGWSGNNYLLADGQLHDLRLPSPFWFYSGLEYVQSRGSRIWASARPAMSATSTLTSYDLPHSQALMSLNAVKERPELFVFKTGDRIKLDLAGIPEDKRGEVQAALEKRLQTLGYTLDPAATAVLFASVETIGTKAAAGYTGYDTFWYTKKAAVLRLVMNGKELWSEAWATEPPFTIRVPLNVTLTDYLKGLGFGEPNYKLFSFAPIPSYFPGPQAPTTPLGSTELTGAKIPGWLPW